jgi:hypothetical protein
VLLFADSDGAPHLTDSEAAEVLVGARRLPANINTRSFRPKWLSSRRQTEVLITDYTGSIIGRSFEDCPSKKLNLTEMKLK